MQGTWKDYRVDVVSNTRLHKVITLPKPVLAFNDSIIIYGSADSIYVYDRHNNSTTFVELPPYLQSYRRFYIYREIILMQMESTIESGISLYKYRNGILNKIDKLNADFSADKYHLIWNNGNNLFYNNLAKDSIIIVSSNALNNGNDVSADGVVAFAERSFNGIYYLKLFKDNQYTTIDSNSAVFPIVDGNMVVFTKASDYPGSIYLYNKNEISTLSSDAGSSASPLTGYDINNGWIAFVKTGNLGQTNVFLRNPTGSTKQISYFGSDCRIRSLNSDGKLIFNNLDKLYFASYDQNPVEISNNNSGIIYWGSDGIYFSIGIGIYKVDITTSASDEVKSSTHNYLLQQNYPNPFNSETTISYSIASPAMVKIKIYDILGQEVSFLVNDYKKAGPHTVKFNAGFLPSGVYTYIIQVNNFLDSKKFVLIK